jgi:formylglycine-generating enzyme required for sulfatase activity
LTRSITLEDGGARRAVSADAFPLALGGAGGAISLPEIEDDRPAAHLGLAEGRVFIQAGDRTPVFCNGASLATSQWLEHGDVVRVGGTRISVRVSGDRFELVITRHEPNRLADTETVLVPPAGPAPQTDPRGRRIRPIPFQPTPVGGPRRLTRRTLSIAVTLLLLLVLATAAIWKLTREQPVEVVVDLTEAPVPETGVPEPAIEEPPEAVVVEQAVDPPPELPPVPARPKFGTLVLSSVPSAATVTIDGRYSGETPLEIELPPGKEVEVALSRVGHDPQAARVSLGVDERRELTLTLEARTGEIEIRAFPSGAELLVDGQPRGPADTTLDLLAVPHQIEIRKDGYESFTRSITPRPGVRQRVDVELKTAEQIREEARVPLIRTALDQELVLIDGGRFTMGADRREPGRRANETLREVELTRSFYLATREVSNKEYREFQEKHRSGAVDGHGLERADHPVVRVSWDQAAQFCNWLSRQDDLPPAYEREGGKLVLIRPTTTGYRLPTEAEWAWAARYQGGGDPLKYPWGNALPVAPGSGNYGDQSAAGVVRAPLTDYDDAFVTTAPTQSFAPNRLGLFNTGGNVAEWVDDHYTVHAPRAALAVDPLGPEQGDQYVIRGSSWMDSKVSELRLTYRDFGSDGRPDVGFRIARWLE